MTTTKNTFSPIDNPFLQAAFRATPSPFASTDPFAVPAPSDEVADDAPEGSYEYKLVQNGPEVPAEECEVPVAAVDLVIRFGVTVLHVAELAPPRSFFVGERSGKEACDFELPAERLGATRAPIVLADGGQVKLVIPAGATGAIVLAGGAAKSVREVLASGLATASTQLAGAHELPLSAGSKATIEVSGVTFEIATGNAGRAVSGRLRLDSRSLPFTGLSLVVHASLLAATALFMPPLAMADEDRINDEQRIMLTAKLDALAEREQEKKDEQLADSSKAEVNGGSGAAAKGESGKMGSATSRATNARWAQEGPKDNADPMIGKAHALKDAGSFGMIGLINTGLLGDANAPIASWGREDPLGRDAKSAMGNMWGEDINDASGIGGLGLSGIGEGGGKTGEGIGVGAIGTINHGSGNGDGSEFGNGHSGGRLAKGHKISSPGTVRMANPTVSGRIPPEVIQRIVRQNFGRFRLCYENGLRNSPNLAGRVSVRFIIGRDGSVSNAANGGSDLPDSGVVSCITRAFYGLSFPQPEGGIVQVTYPIVLSPAN